MKLHHITIPLAVFLISIIAICVYALAVEIIAYRPVAKHMQTQCRAYCVDAGIENSSWKDNWCHCTSVMIEP